MSPPSGGNGGNIICFITTLHSIAFCSQHNVNKTTLVARRGAHIFCTFELIWDLCKFLHLSCSVLDTHALTECQSSSVSKAEGCGRLIKEWLLMSRSSPREICCLPGSFSPHGEARSAPLSSPRDWWMRLLCPKRSRFHRGTEGAALWINHSKRRNFCRAPGVEWAV